MGRVEPRLKVADSRAGMVFRAALQAAASGERQPNWKSTLRMFLLAATWVKISGERVSR